MANTTADKLALLQATKANLKAALAEKGQTVGDVFSTYPAAVRAIGTGGSGIAIKNPTSYVDLISSNCLSYEVDINASFLIPAIIATAPLFALSDNITGYSISGTINYSATTAVLGTAARRLNSLYLALLSFNSFNDLTESAKSNIMNTLSSLLALWDMSYSRESDSVSIVCGQDQCTISIDFG